MKTKLTPRLENAITKLYTAFHEGTLTYWDCAKCAVGNLVESEGQSVHLVNNKRHGRPLNWQSAEKRHPGITKKIKTAGYSIEELLIIENLFAWGIRDFETDDRKWRSGDGLKETQFKGLCAVVAYLCELDGVEDVMSYQRLFETKENQPKYELNFVNQ